MAQKAPRIALIHAVQVAMAPVQQAFQEQWPEATLMSVLDDSLPADLQRDAGITPQMFNRFERLAQYCIEQGSDAVLFTCSAFGPAIERVAKTAKVPVLKPNEAMFDKAFEYGAKVGMLATFQPAVAPMEAEFNESARKTGSKATIETVCVPAALEAAKGGNYELHNRLLVNALPHFNNFDVLLLAHFSMAPAIHEIQRHVSIPVLTSPYAAVERLKAVLA